MNSIWHTDACTEFICTLVGDKQTQIDRTTIKCAPCRPWEELKLIPGECCGECVTIVTAAPTTTPMITTTSVPEVTTPGNIFG